MINFADDIKNRVSMREVCYQYGIEIVREKAICPFHNDTHASMQIYDGQRGWFCFVCNEGGDVISFVQRYFGLDFHGACEKINNDFRLGLPIGKQLSLREYREAEQAAKKRRERIEKEKAKRQALIDEYNAALDDYVILDIHRTEYAPKRENCVLNDFYVESIKNICFAENRLTEAEMRLYEYEHNGQ